MLLKRYKDKFSGNPLGATWGYLRQIARDALPPNPLVSHDTQPSHLRDSSFLVKTLRCDQGPLQIATSIAARHRSTLHSVCTHAVDTPTTFYVVLYGSTPIPCIVLSMLLCVDLRCTTQLCSASLSTQEQGCAMVEHCL